MMSIVNDEDLITNSQTEIRRKQGFATVHNKEELGDKLVEWAKLPDSVNLNAFCGIIGVSPPQIYVFAKQSVYFKECLDLARSYLASHREERLSVGLLHTKAYDVNAAHYDYFLKMSNRDEKQFEVDLGLRKEGASDDEVSRFNALMSQLRALQGVKKGGEGCE
jgi:hypothetical protein